MFIILYLNRLNGRMLSIMEHTGSDRPAEKEGAQTHSPIPCTFPHSCSSTPGSNKPCYQNPSAWNLYFFQRDLNQLLIKRDFIKKIQPDPSEHTSLTFAPEQVFRAVLRKQHQNGQRFHAGLSLTPMAQLCWMTENDKHKRGRRSR